MVILIYMFPTKLLQRITIPEIKTHPWFLKNLPIEMTDGYQSSVQNDTSSPLQSAEEIAAIVQEARKPPEGPNLGIRHLLGGSMDLDDMDSDMEDLDDIEDSGDFVCAL